MNYLSEYEYTLTDSEYREFELLMEDQEEFEAFVRSQTALVNGGTVADWEEIIMSYGWDMPEIDEHKRRLAIWLLTGY